MNKEQSQSKNSNNDNNNYENNDDVSNDNTDSLCACALPGRLGVGDISCSPNLTRCHCCSCSVV